MAERSYMHDADEQLRVARNNFVRVVGESMNKLTEEHGYGRDRASLLILREIGENPSHLSDKELNHVKQSYRLAHNHASRALSVSLAFKKLVQRGRLSHADAVRELTDKLASATFTSCVNDDAVAHATAAASRSKASEISIATILEPPKQRSHQPQPAEVVVPQHAAGTQTEKPQKAEHRPESSSPAKRPRSASSSTCKAGLKLGRKRSIEETSATISLNPAQQRPRADSVTEAVSAKLQKQEPEKQSQQLTGARTAKRNRATSLEMEADSGTKRPRTSTA